MKNLFLTFALSCFGLSFGQGALHIENYSPYKIAYTIWKSNNNNTAGNCEPILESRIQDPAGMGDMFRLYLKNPQHLMLFKLKHITTRM